MGEKGKNPSRNGGQNINERSCEDGACKMIDAQYAVAKFINSLDKEKDRV